MKKQQNMEAVMLTPKQELFCQEYLRDRNGTQAAIRARYAANSAQEQASRLLSNVMVKARINELIKEQLDQLSIDVRFVLRQLLNSATTDIGDAYYENHNLRPVHEMSEPLHKAIVSIETNELYEGHGKDRHLIGYTKKIKIESRLKALELLGKHLKMFTDVMKHEGLEGLAEKIKEAQERAAKCITQQGL